MTTTAKTHNYWQTNNNSNNNLFHSLQPPFLSFKSWHGFFNGHWIACDAFWKKAFPSQLLSFDVSKLVWIVSCDHHWAFHCLAVRQEHIIQFLDFNAFKCLLDQCHQLINSGSDCRALKKPRSKTLKSGLFGGWFIILMFHPSLWPSSLTTLSTYVPCGVALSCCSLICIFLLPLGHEDRIAGRTLSLRYFA